MISNFFAVRLRFLLRLQRLSIFLLAILGSAGASAERIIETLHSFGRSPALPNAGPLVAGPDGYFWGIAQSGGTFNSGAIYKVKADGTDWTTVASFPSFSIFHAPATPLGGLVYDGAGFFWGTTSAGGDFDQGCIFKVDASTGVLSNVFAFQRNDVSGGAPASGLVPDGSGNFWGTTTAGGTHDAGTIFKINASTEVLTTLISFTDHGPINNGREPRAGLVSDGQGFFWGSTAVGGAYGCGTIFKLDAATGALTTVIEFTGTGAQNRGSNPFAELTDDGQGFFWGTTRTGGAENFGTVFKINAATGALTTLWEFSNMGLDYQALYPTSRLISDGHGFFWGTTSGGDNNLGSVFKIEIANGDLTSLFQFSYADSSRGQQPLAGLIDDGQGSMLGTTSHGGLANGDGYGTIFKVDIATGTFNSLVRFLGDYGSGNRGRFPIAGLLGAGDEKFWGVTYSGGTFENGTIFKSDPTTGETTTVVDFTGTGGSTQGRLPVGALAPDSSNGFLWGTTSRGGTSDLGTVFKIYPSVGTFITVVEFTGSTGAQKGSFPSNALASDDQNNMWGTTDGGGTNDFGTIFKINGTTGAFTTLVEFTGNAGAAPGTSPGFIVNDGQGFLWGVALRGGADGCGTIFKVNLATGAFSTVLEFTGNGGIHRGSSPRGLVDDYEGNFWGVTYGGGINGTGTVFKLNRETGVLTTVTDFEPQGSGAVFGPCGNLIRDGNGFFWGVTSVGPASNEFGKVFKVDAQTGALATVIAFTGTGSDANSGWGPPGSLSRGTDEHFYGTTSFGGPLGGGKVFRILMGPLSTTALPAENITQTTARLRASVNPNGVQTHAFLEVSKDPTFNSPLSSFHPITIDPSDVVPVALTVDERGLAPDTTYYFRVEAYNFEFSSVRLSNVVSFTTGPNTAPHITLKGNNPMTHTAGTPFVDPGAAASDAEDGPLTPSILSNDVQPDVPGTYTVTWTVTDRQNLSTTVSRTVNVVDNVPPQIIPAAPADIAVNATSSAGAVVTYPPITATDLFGVASITYSQESGTLFSPGRTVVTVTAKDFFNNTATATFAVDVMPGAFDRRAPVVTITTPKGNRVGQGFDITGTVKDDVALSSVIVKLNGVTLPLKTPWGASPSTAANWSVIGVNPENGVNVIQVLAMDFSGRTSHVSKTVTFTNERPELAGIYQALLLPSGTPTNTSVASLTVTVSKTGSFTGNLRYHGNSFGFAGVVGNDGQAHFKPDSGTLFTLDKSRPFFLGDPGQLAFRVNATAGLSASISSLPGSGGATIATGVAKISNYNAAHLAPFNLLNLPLVQPSKGVYNLFLPSRPQTPALAASEYPQGHGYLTLTVTKFGAIAVVGKLADGSAFSTPSVLRADGTAPLFVSLYQRSGFACGELAFANLPDSDVSGTGWHWVRPKNDNAAVYSNGWTDVRLNPIGTKYAQPTSLDFGQGTVDPINGNASLDFSDGFLAAPRSLPVSVDRGTGAVRRIPANNPAFTLGFKPATGAFGGTFVHSNGKRASYAGVVVKKGSTRGGFGFFLSPGKTAPVESGAVEIDPSGP